MRDQPAPVSVLSGLSAIAAEHPAIICDIWGVLHNGVENYSTAAQALVRYRAGGGKVVLVTNAPRPSREVLQQLEDLHVDRQAFDAIITSGDVTREMLASYGGVAAYHVGPQRDLPLYEGLPLHLADETEATLLSCTGLFDDKSESPESYEERLAGWAARGLPMVCANSDLVVERGGRLVWCAGALAERYEKLGGRVILVGKPHRPIYVAALARLEALQAGIRSPRSVLAIGDGVPTDILGAQRQEFSALFITSGIHAGELAAPQGALDGTAVAAFLAERGVAARYCMTRLAW